MSKLLKSLDMLGENFKIYLNQQEKMKSLLGGCLTLFIMATTLVFVWFIGKDLVYKSDPFNYQQQAATKKYFNNTINKTNFPLAFGLADSNNIPLTNYTTYLNFDLVHFSYDFDETGNLINLQKNKIQLSKCQYEDFPLLTHEEFDNAVLANGLCPQTDSILLYGYWSENSLSFLTANVKLCDYDKPENNCNSHEEIQEYISKNSINFGLWVLEPQIVITNYSQPVQHYIISPYKFLFVNGRKIVNYFIDRNTVTTDAGILFESTEIVEYYKIRELQTDTADYDSSTKRLLTYTFYSSNMQTVYVRKYIKIPQILASTGGLFKIFTLIGYYINVCFSRIQMNLATIKCLFSTEDNDIDNKAERKTMLTTKSVHSDKLYNMNKKCVSNLQLNNNYTKVILNTTNNSNSELDSIMKKIKSRKPAAIKLSASDYLYLICQREKNTSKNFNLYKNASRIIKDHFDMIFIINKLNEFEIMKEIIFTESQRKILENIKSVLTDEGNNENQIFKKANELEEELINVFNSQNKTNIDQKLLKMIVSLK